MATDLTRSVIDAPALPPRPLACAAQDFDVSLSHESVLVTAGRCRPTEGPAGELRASILRGVDLSSVPLRAWRLTDAGLETVNLANADASAARLRRVAVERCRATGLSISQSTLRDVVFEDCRCDMLAAFGATLTRCWFQNCDLREADFDGATLDRVVFRDCDLRSARLARVDLGGTDVRGSRIDGLIVSPERLAGLTIEPVQADVFAAILGLRVAAAPAVDDP